MADSRPDRRTTPYREDIAAAHLRDVITAPLYVEGARFRVSTASVPLRRGADPALAYDSELLFGEAFDVYEQRDGWAWGQAEADGYVGFVPMTALSPAGPRPTHRIAAVRTFVYPAPGIKVTPHGFLPYGARVVVEGREDRFVSTPEGYLFAEHVVPVDHFASDMVTEAERFLGVPYLWGGRSSLGLDCSGLVQMACQAAGLAAPRDSDMQEAALGDPIPIPAVPEGFERGDLLFWRGHVAMCQGGGRMIHATAFSMNVISEPIGPAITRIAAQGDPLRRARRIASK